MYPVLELVWQVLCLFFDEIRGESIGDIKVKEFGRMECADMFSHAGIERERGRVSLFLRKHSELSSYAECNFGGWGPFASAFLSYETDMMSHMCESKPRELFMGSGGTKRKIFVLSL